jgi:hypothetical protein
MGSLSVPAPSASTKEKKEWWIALWSVPHNPELSTSSTSSVFLNTGFPGCKPAGLSYRPAHLLQVHSLNDFWSGLVSGIQRISALKGLSGRRKTHKKG